MLRRRNMKSIKKKNPYIKPEMSVFGDLKKVTADGGPYTSDGDWGTS